MEIMTASRQWATRPSDQRFTSLTELNAFVHSVKERSAARVISSRRVSLAPVEGDGKALVAVGPDGRSANLTHWSFGQVAQRAAAPAAYLRTLAPELAADCINYSLARRDIEEVGVLLYQNGTTELRAMTGPNYGRIWNATITQALLDRFGDGVTGQFKVPGEFGKRVAITKENTTLYASDRDMFVFLADEENRIEIPNRRNGRSGSLSRGFFAWNSEVGSSTFGLATFLFDYVCCNRIIWGAEEYKEIKLRHFSGAPDRWIEDVAPAIEAYANSSTKSITDGIAEARKARLDDVDAFLLKRFTKGQASAIKAAHMNDEQKPIETLWDAATGVTAYARELTHQDERVRLEREAGKILDLAA